jgi:integrase/recombinase XerD
MSCDTGIPETKEAGLSFILLRKRVTDKETVISLSVAQLVLGILSFSLLQKHSSYMLSLSKAECSMPGKQAKILSSTDVGDLLVFASCTRNPLRNRVLVLLSAKAGLRAGEIANLTWDMVLDPTGQISGMIELRDHAAKKGSGRVIPIHPELRDALAALRNVAALSEHAVTSERGGPMTPLSIVVWFSRAFKSIGLQGCSSHSGRRTFVTRAARLVHKAGGSLRDVQLLAGHRSIQTTQRYIDGDSDAQRKLVSMI